MDARDIHSAMPAIRRGWTRWRTAAHLWIAGVWHRPARARRPRRCAGRAAARSRGGARARGAAGGGGRRRHLGRRAGIDAASHRGALDSRTGAGRTVAVLGTGIDVRIPSATPSCSRRCRVGRRALTQFEPGKQPRRGQFPTRNVVIAGLADVVVVVEAGLRRARCTRARDALALGRTVVALPGSHGTDTLLTRRRAAATAPRTCSRSLDGASRRRRCCRRIRGVSLRARIASRATWVSSRSAPGWRSAPVRRWWWISSLVDWLRALQAGVTSVEVNGSRQDRRRRRSNATPRPRGRPEAKERRRPRRSVRVRDEGARRRRVAGQGEDDQEVPRAPASP